MLALSLKKNTKLEIIDKRLNKLNSKKYRVKILYSGICSSDIPRAFKKGCYKYPLVMGHEMSGEIVEKGTKTQKYNIGDKISIYPLIPKCKKCLQCKLGNFNLCENYSYYGSREDGGFTEFLDVHEWNVYKLKNKINIKLASLIEPTAVAYNVYNKIELKSKKGSILIIGCGFLGQVLSRILYQNNMKNITCIDRNRFKLNFLKNFSKKLILGDLNKLNNLKFDCIIDFVGSKTSFETSLIKLNPKGILVFPANIYQNFSLKKKIINLIARKEISIKGVWNSMHIGKKSNWNSAERFLVKNNDNIFQIITHEIKLSKSVNFFNFLSEYKKNNKNKNKYLKGIIEN